MLHEVYVHTTIFSNGHDSTKYGKINFVKKIINLDFFSFVFMKQA